MYICKPAYALYAFPCARAEMERNDTFPRYYFMEFLRMILTAESSTLVKDLTYLL